MRTFKVLALLLSYPESEIRTAADDMSAALDAEALLPPATRTGVDRLIAELRDGDLIDTQARYVDLFDRSRANSLHLFEHVHGESRDRGQAMVDLRRLYARHGLAIEARELPDYLPLFLEFLSQLPLDAAREHLGEAAHVVAALAKRLEHRESPYGAVLRAVVDLAASEPAPDAVADVVAAVVAAERDDADIDSTWTETPVAFGTPSAC